MTTKDFSYKFCKDNQLLPEVRDNSIKIFHTEDCDINAIAHIQSKFKIPIPTQIIVFSDFNKMLSESYSDTTQSSESLAENIHEDVDLDSLVMDLPKTEDLLDDSTDSPVIRLINAILSEAIKDGASDIHIEPYEETLLIRFRTDGILKDCLLYTSPSPRDS